MKYFRSFSAVIEMNEIYKALEVFNSKKLVFSFNHTRIVFVDAEVYRKEHKKEHLKS